MRSDSDYPLSIFREAVVSTVGRVVGFLLVCCFTPVVTSFLLRGRWEDLSQLLEPTLILAGAAAFAAQILVGFYQVWGMLAHAILIGLFYYHVFLEGRMRLALGGTFLVLSMECIRIFIMTPETKVGAVPVWRWIVILCLWGGIFTALALFLKNQGELGIPLTKRRPKPSAAA
jgi:hypothetical protein